jgi:hypothetical protein
MYKVVGVVKRHSKCCEPGAESRASREAGVFAMLTGHTIVTVLESASAQIKVTVMNGMTVQVRGLLFFTGENYDLVAGRIVQP